MVRIVYCFLALVLIAAQHETAGIHSLPAPAANTPWVAAIVWHDVLPQKDVWFDTTRDTFASELAAIKRGGFHVVTLAALEAHLERNAPLPRKPLVLTFDDNGLGIFQNAFPLLQRYRYPATLFVHTNYVGKTTSKRHSTWDDLRTMERSGLVVVQSQTANHPEDLRVLSDSDVLHELRLSRISIENHLGHGTDAIAYPYDNYDARVERLAAANGYRLGFTEDWGNACASGNLLEIHRYSALTRFDQALDDVARNQS